MTTAANPICVGPESETAGISDSCAGCPNQSQCKDGIKIDPDIEIIKQRLNVKKIVLVLSGKGGVGKSTISTNLSNYLSIKYQVGLLDLDITGPSLARMTGSSGEQVHKSNQGWTPVSISDSLQVMSIAYMIKESDPVIWRSSKKHGLIKQFLRDVDWGCLDYLIIDTPPGTGDEHLSIVNLLGDLIDGAIVVTTPQEISLQDVRKEINFCERVGIKVLGVVENMAGFKCPNCKKESFIFARNTGGAARLCEQMHVKLLGSLPIDPKVAKSSDYGVELVSDEWDSLLDVIHDIIKV